MSKKADCRAQETCETCPAAEECEEFDLSEEGAHPITVSCDCGDYVEGRTCEQDSRFICGPKQCHADIHWPVGSGYAQLRRKRKKGAK